MWSKLWIIGLMLWMSGTNGDAFVIKREGQPVAELHRADYLLPIPGTPLVDETKLDQHLAKLARRLNRPPVNATLDDHGRIVPEQYGQELNLDQVKLAYLDYAYGTASVQLNDPFVTVYPRVDRTLLAHVCKKRISGYVTYFNAGNANRAHNIALAAKAINGTVVFPGEQFSFNRVVGKRTKEKGYLPAPVIVKGELSEGIGGGICQVSSTLFNAVDRAGLHIVKRYSHSREVPYVPPGRDATVSWYGPDFVFQNRYPYPVLIRARAQHGQVAVSVHSYPELEHEPRHVPSASTELPPEIRQVDSERR